LSAAGGAPPSGEAADIHRLAQLGRFVRWLLPVTFVFTAIEALTFLLSPQPAIALTAILTGGYGLWLLVAWRRARRTAVASFAARMAMGMLTVIVILAIVQPEASPQLTVAALLPVIVVLPYLDDHALRRFIGFAWVIAMFVALMGAVMPPSIVLPAAYTTAFRIAVLGVVFGLALFLLWQFSTRLKTSARELGSLVELSSAVLESMDPRQIGDMTAAHLARATGADECGICYWDRPGDRVLTYGYYPVERRSAVDDVYDLADYPATRRVLDEHVDMHVDAGGADADPAEVEFLGSIGMRSMAMLPLVARGEAIGAVELYWRTETSPEDARLGLGRSLAQAAAIALDNARLYEEIRHQAFHDGLTGLANRALFGDRVDHALARSARTGSLVAVLFVDLDDFKTVNDRFGHQAGDQLLRSIGERIVSIVRPGDTAARLGGDEFAVLLEDVHGAEDAQVVAERLIRRSGRRRDWARSTRSWERASASPSRPRAASAPATSSRTPTSPCIEPRERARVATSCSRRACGPAWPNGPSSSRSSTARWIAASCGSRTSRSSSSRPARSSAPRHSSAGTRRGDRCSCPPTSSPSRRRTARSWRSAGGSSRRRAASGDGGRTSWAIPASASASTCPPGSSSTPTSSATCWPRLPRPASRPPR